jgi:hypothetical protein
MAKAAKRRSIGLWPWPPPVVAAVLLGGFVGCGTEERIACSSAAIVGGTSAEEFLGIAGIDAAGIVRLEFELSDLSGTPGTETCSGALIGRATVLTAAHCTHGLDVRTIHVATSDRSGSTLSLGSASVLRAVPEQDVLALRLSAAVPAEVASPLALASGAPEIGQFLEIAGYGATRSAESGGLEFAVERVVSSAPDGFTVSSEGASGACAGDSGGPALRRGSDGRLEVVGLLSSGSAGCLSEDQYALVSGVREWLPADMEYAVEAHPACPTYGSVGRCYGDRVVYCDGGALRGEVCAANGCGFSMASGGYRCLSHERDACEGAPELGTCIGDDAVFCSSGVLERQPCGACRARCGLLPSTGRAACIL